MEGKGVGVEKEISERLVRDLLRNKQDSGHLWSTHLGVECGAGVGACRSCRFARAGAGAGARKWKIKKHPTPILPLNYVVSE